MFQDDADLVLAFEAGANEAIEELLQRIMTGESTENAKGLLLFLARKYPVDSPHELDALTYYRGMRASLNTDCCKTRRERVQQYRRYLELFEIEVHGRRSQIAEAMAPAQDWSMIGAHAWGAIRIRISGWLLRLAGILHYVGIPAALNLCDAAAFSLLRSAYLPT